MFQVSDALLVNKIDVAQIFDFDFDACKERARKLNASIEVFPLSSLTGENFEEWLSWLRKQIEEDRR